MDCHFLLQGIFPTQGSNPGLPHHRQTLYPLSHQGSLGSLKTESKSVSSSVLSDSVTPWTAAHQAPLSIGFSRQEHWSGLPFSSPRDLPNPGIKPRSPPWQADFLLSEPPGKLYLARSYVKFYLSICLMYNVSKMRGNIFFYYNKHGIVISSNTDDFLLMPMPKA